MSKETKDRFQVEGALPVGVDYDGKLHTEFNMVATKTKHLLAARVATAEKLGFIAEEKSALNLRVNYNQTLNAALIAEQLVFIGEIPRNEINLDLILDLSFLDYDTLTEAGAELDGKVNQFRDGGKTDKKSDRGAPRSDGGDAG